MEGLLAAGGKYHGKAIELYIRVCKTYDLPFKNGKGEFIHYCKEGVADTEDFADGAGEDEAPPQPTIGVF